MRGSQPGSPNPIGRIAFASQVLALQVEGFESGLPKTAGPVRTTEILQPHSAHVTIGIESFLGLS